MEKFTQIFRICVNFLGNSERLELLDWSNGTSTVSGASGISQAPDFVKKNKFKKNFKKTQFFGETFH